MGGYLFFWGDCLLMAPLVNYDLAKNVQNFVTPFHSIVAYVPVMHTDY